MSPQPPKWFRCLADVPGVGYTSDPARRARLRGRDAVPEVLRTEFDGEKRASLCWPTPDGSSSASPVHALAFADLSAMSNDDIREHVLSALELPGVVSDYHFAMQSAAETLHKRRREAPSVMTLVEWLYWSDVRLLDAHESSFRVEPDAPEYFRVVAITFLTTLLVNEGHLREALAFTERMQRFQPDEDILLELRSRVTAMAGER